MKDVATILLDPSSTKEEFSSYQMANCDAEVFVPIISPRGITPKSLLMENDKSSELKGFRSW